MKILHTVESYTPSVGGMQEVVRQLSERLVSLGHQVTVATSAHPDRPAGLINGVEVVPFQVSGNLVRGMQGEVTQYQQFLGQRRFDLVVNFAAQQWATDAAITMLHDIPGRKVFVPTGFSGLHLPAYREYFRQMPDWLGNYDRVVYLSEQYQDYAFAREHGLTNGICIPNGADEREFDPDNQTVTIRQTLRIPEQHLVILLVGSHSGLKGHAEAISIFAQARLTQATLLIIANDSRSRCGRRCRLMQRLWPFRPGSRAADKRLLVTELDRSATLAAYRTADLFLFPSQVECSPLVLFEAMASGTPFLASDAGNAVEIADWSGSGRILPTTRDTHGRVRTAITPSARMLEQLVADSEQRRTMAARGRQVWQERFTWQVIAGRYDELYRELAG